MTAAFDFDVPPFDTLNAAQQALVRATASVVRFAADDPVLTAEMEPTHAFLQSKTSQLIGSLETGAVKFLTIVADRQSAKAQTRLEAAQAAAHGGAPSGSGMSDPLPSHA